MPLVTAPLVRGAIEGMMAMAMAIDRESEVIKVN